MHNIRSSRYVRLFSFLLCVSILSLGVLVFAPTPASAQNVSGGGVSGQVTDQQGAAVPGADVRLMDVTTNTPRVVSTNSDGRYTFNNIPPGNYNLEVRKQGFAMSRVEKQAVEVGLVLTLNVTLQIGTAATTIEVQAQAGAELQTSNATVGSTVTGDAIMSLPNLGRDANAFTVLQPGVSPTGEVAGLPSDTSMFQLDGGNNSNDMDGSMTSYTPASGYIGPSTTGGVPSGVIPTPAESIEEFKVTTSNQTADFNQAGGSQVQMVTKRGTNSFHGSLYEYYLSSAVGANFWLNNHTPDTAKGLPYTPLPSSHQNRFGTSFGGPLLPKFLGGKTYFFVNYEGRRFPQATTIEKLVPTPSLRAGIITLRDVNGNEVGYNINPYPVTVGGVSYPACGGANYCDPRGIGMNSLVSTVWSKYMPLPNDPTQGDRFNTQGYLSAISLPQSSDFGVARVDHDFGDKWHFMATYRYYKFVQTSNAQIDIGGILCGSLGQACAVSTRPQQPWYLVFGLTGSLTPNTTMDIHVSYLRNFWQWGDDASPAQLPGLGGALEMGGESKLNSLVPYNVDTQDTRQRFWDGKDKMIRDDISSLHGNHLIQFGGSYQRNYDFHQRNDNGVGIDTSPVYQLGTTSSAGSGLVMTANTPGSLASSSVSPWARYYSMLLGIVTQSQVMYSRAGSTLALQPLGTPLFDQSIIPTYDMYLSDTWHMRKDFTLTYGLSYSIEMPPYEVNGKQVQVVDSSGNLVSVNNYLAQDQAANLAGQSYDPTIGFETIRNVNKNSKYPYNPFYGGISPRVSAAWNPNFTSGILGTLFGNGQTVIRGGYSRIYGRLNGVDLVLIPLLGTGLAQAVSCIGATSSGVCAGAAGANPATAFRIGTDGLTAPLPAVSQTLPQPYFPGVGGNAPAGDGSALDPNFKPDRSDQFMFSIQRAFSQKVLIETGYIGRIIRNEWQGINLNAVPTMNTQNGQTFANAWANLYLQTCGSGSSCIGSTTPSPQPWFEAALGGPTSAYCAGYASCTAAVAAKQASNISNVAVFDFWNALSTSPSWKLGRTILGSSPQQVSGSLSMYNSLGYGNYNAAFVSLTMRDWHGVTARSNFTWSKALGTGDQVQATSGYTAVNPFDLHSMYGPQTFDVKFNYNLSMLWQTPWFRDQKGILGRALGGWNIAPLFVAASGYPNQVNIDGDCQAFGEINCSSGSTLENAMPISAVNAGTSAHYNIPGSNGVGTNGDPAAGGSGINQFANPAAVYAQFRPCILGYDTSCGGAGVLRGFPSWNLDLTVSKDFRVAERIGITFSAQFSNLLNHMQPQDPFLDITDPGDWGVVSNQSLGATANGIGVPPYYPRQIEFGLRIHF